jgi:hypothetical protein
MIILKNYGKYTLQMVDINIRYPSLLKQNCINLNQISTSLQYKLYVGIGRSFKFILKAGVEDLIVNAPRLQSKNTNNAKSEVRFKQSWSVICIPWCVHKFKWIPDTFLFSDIPQMGILLHLFADLFSSFQFWNILLQFLIS